jgi:hypothetical protein
VAGCCEYGYGPSGSGATKLVSCVQSVDLDILTEYEN